MKAQTKFKRYFGGTDHHQSIQQNRLNQRRDKHTHTHTKRKNEQKILANLEPSRAQEPTSTTREENVTKLHNFCLVVLVNVDGSIIYMIAYLSNVKGKLKIGGSRQRKEEQLKRGTEHKAAGDVSAQKETRPRSTWFNLVLNQNTRSADDGTSWSNYPKLIPIEQ